jgi:sarcosine oxidase subunit gamma
MPGRRCSVSASAPRTFPLSPGGPAEGVVLPAGAVDLVDLTATPRMGLKGPGSSAWLAAQGFALPAVNRIAWQDGVRVLRLGTEDLLVTGEGCPALATLWQAGKGSRGYWSWREEGWAWMRLSGPLAAAAMARLCAVDLREESMPDDMLVQTRVAQLEAVVLRDAGAFEIFFDIASTALFARTVADAGRRAARAAGPSPEGRP